MLQRFIALKGGPIVAAFMMGTLGSIGFIANASGASNTNRFDMVRSAVAEKSGCLPDAKAEVRIVRRDENEQMRVSVSGLPANTEFDLFIVQLPDAPFGVAWYQS